MAQQYSFEQIEDYLDGNLKGEEKSTFEEEASANPELAAEIFKHRQTRKVNELYTRQQLMEKVKSIHQQVKEENSSSAFSFMKIAASLALLIVAGAVYFFLFGKYSVENIADNAFEPYPNRFRTMGDESEDGFSKAMEFYDMQNYQQAVGLFQSIPETDPHYLAAQFYLGISYLAMDNPRSSVDALQIVKAEEDNLFADASFWYLSLAYLESGQVEEAKELLQSVVAGNGYKAREAQILLKQLNSPVRKLPGIN